MRRITKKPKTYFFVDKPLFGLDIGHDQLRVVELDMGHTVPVLKAYGMIGFDPKAVVDGVIVKPELIAKVVVKLFRGGLVGKIDTNRVAIALPANRALTCVIQIPHMNPKDVYDAVRTEAEQFIPISADDLYFDYNTLRDNVDGVEIFVVAMPKKIVDSYLILTRMLGLEAVLFDTAIGASARLFARDTRSNMPSVLVDFGAVSTDITVFSHGLVVTGTVVFGGDHITRTIAKTLNITDHEATVIKSRYGLSVSGHQKQIKSALLPSLELLIKEIRRALRYYEQRYKTEPPIGQVIVIGGGGNMPGLVEFLTDRLYLPARTFDPSIYIEFSHLKEFKKADHMAYITAAGLAITNPVELFQ
jgi:type IV pilus assembly protein PilM